MIIKKYVIFLKICLYLIKQQINILYKDRIQEPESRIKDIYFYHSVIIRNAFINMPEKSRTTLFGRIMSNIYSPK